MRTSSTANVLHDPPAVSGPPRGKRRVFISLALLGVILVAGFVRAWLYLTFSRQALAGLEGTWRDPNNPRHVYQFQPSGEVDAWYGDKSWWNKRGWSATWRRDGQQITVRTDRNWDFVGLLDREAIRGKMLIRDQSGATVNTTDAVWQKE